MTAAEPTDSGPPLPRTPRDVARAVREIGSIAQPHAARHDREASFVHEGYDAIRATRYGAIAVPEALGGAGHDLAMVCRAQSMLARFCANTALAIAMHQHNVLSLAWRWRLGDDQVEPILRRIASDGVLLSSSGAADRSNPGVTAVPADGGVRVTGRKGLCSGVPGTDLVATLAMLEDEDDRTPITVLVPMSDPGSQVVDDWDAMGMRGSGSNPVTFTDVFVPDGNILGNGPVGRRGRGRGRRRGGPGAGAAAGPGTVAPDELADADDAGDDVDPVSDAAVAGTGRGRIGPGVDSNRIPALHIALTVIASVYLGAAGGVRDRALRIAASGPALDDPSKQRIAGLMTHEVRSARWALDALIGETTDEALGTEAHYITTMLAKRHVVLSSIRTVELAMELLGTRSYLRSLPFEQALRDVRAGITHPLAPENTLLEVGRSALANFAPE